MPDEPTTVTEIDAQLAQVQQEVHDLAYTPVPGSQGEQPASVPEPVPVSPPPSGPGGSGTVESPASTPGVPTVVTPRPDTYVYPTDTWESVAERVGVPVNVLFALNAGLGGATTMQTVPVGYYVRLPGDV